MKSFKIIPFVEGPKCIFYTIKFLDEEISESQKFLDAYQISHLKDVELIVSSIDIMAELRGARENSFRFEGIAVALPSKGDKSSLRLYSLRISQQIVILGNGGIKPPHIRTYQDDPFLNSCVKTIEEVEKLLKERNKDGDINYFGFKIRGNCTFDFDEDGEE